MSDTPEDRLASLVAAVVEPVLPAPFRLGQGAPAAKPPDHPLNPAATDPWPTESASLLWCAGLREMWAAYPTLERIQRQCLDDFEGACFDVMIDFDDHGHLERVDLEITALAEALVAVGDEDGAARARTLTGLPGRQSTYVVAKLLGHVFGTHI